MSLAYETPKTNPQRITRKVIRNTKRFNWEGLEFPLQVKDISKFEKNNPGIAIDVFGFEKKVFPPRRVEVFPLRISKVDGVPVDVFLISNEEGKKYFCLIQDLSKLLAYQVGNQQHKMFFCRRCLNHFYSEKKLEERERLCENRNERRNFEIQKLAKEREISLCSLCRF